MQILNDYNQFEGLHWETGSLRNFYAYEGITAPHTGEPYSEEILLGISGGITMGYFTFHYEGYEPWVRILTRNTFNPLDKIYARLRIQSNVRQTSSKDTGIKNLLEVLEAGSPAIVYADMFSLPYNAAHQDEGMWIMLPILVYGYDDQDDQVWIADRARVPLSVTTGQLTVARGRTKKNKYKIITHEPPIVENLKSAVLAGIQECVQLFTEPPPKGSKHNFGFMAYEKWVKKLGESNGKTSWAKRFSPGNFMYAGLTSAFNDICIFGKDGGAEREKYANFLEEASQILSKPSLTEPAEMFRVSAKAWDGLANALLPDEINLFKKTKLLMLERHHLFLNKGNAALDDILVLDDQLVEIKKQVSEAFPLDSSHLDDFKFSIAEKILAIREIEYSAIQELQKAVR